MPEHLWRKMAGAYLLGLVLTLIPFFLVKLVFHTTARALAGPYMAFLVPQWICLTLSMWLRKLEERGVSPKRLAIGWCVMIAFFYWAVIAACFYAGVTLRIVRPGDPEWVFVFGMMAIVGTASSYFIGYKRTLQVILARSNPAVG